MIDTVNGRTLGSQLFEKTTVVLGAGHYEARQSNFLLQLSGGRSIDILGVGAKTEWQAAQFVGKQGHRGGRMGKVSVQVTDVRAGKQGVNQISCLE